MRSVSGNRLINPCPPPLEDAQQVALVKEFMLVIAPEVVRHHLSQLRHQQLNPDLDDEGLSEYHGLAETGARITLELAMHLAARYASVYDSVVTEAH